MGVQTAEEGGREEGKMKRALLHAFYIQFGGAGGSLVLWVGVEGWNLVRAARWPSDGPHRRN